MSMLVVAETNQLTSFVALLFCLQLILVVANGVNGQLVALVVGAVHVLDLNSVVCLTNPNAHHKLKIVIPMLVLVLSMVREELKLENTANIKKLSLC